MCTLEKKGKIFILTLTGQDEHRLNPTLIDSIHSAIRRVRSEASSSSSSALITTAQGKFFSNGYDLDWVGSSQTRGPLLESKLKPLIADLISLPLPTIAAVSGHASAAGFILALSHDYVLMRIDRGFIYMSELDIRLPISTWVVALIKCKVGAPATRRLLLLTAAKVTAKDAMEKGIIDSAHDSAESTVKEAVGLAEKLVERKWDGDVYAQIRMELFSEVLGQIRVDNCASRL